MSEAVKKLQSLFKEVESLNYISKINPVGDDRWYQLFKSMAYTAVMAALAGENNDQGYMTYYTLIKNSLDEAKEILGKDKGLSYLLDKKNI